MSTENTPPRKPRQQKSVNKPSTRPAKVQQSEDSLEPIYSTPRPPRIVPDGIYSEQDVCHNMHLSPKQFRAWRRRKANPLRPLPFKAKQIFYSGRELITFWSSLESEEAA